RPSQTPPPTWRRSWLPGPRSENRCAEPSWCWSKAVGNAPTKLLSPGFRDHLDIRRQVFGPVYKRKRHPASSGRGGPALQSGFERAEDRPHDGDHIPHGADTLLDIHDDRPQVQAGSSVAKAGTSCPQAIPVLGDVRVLPVHCPVAVARASFDGARHVPLVRE